MKIAIISVTKQGDAIAEKLRGELGAESFKKSSTEIFDIKTLTQRLMDKFQGIIFIASTGIAVRSIAPFIKGKDVDPAVVVIDSTGKYVISLLSGHLGGANELTLKVAEILSAQPVITTASDNMGFEAADIIAKKYDLIIEDLRKAKDVAALMVAGEKVSFLDEEGIINIPAGYTSCLQEAKARIVVTNRLRYKDDILTLRLLRRNIVIGIGCRKGYKPQSMKETLLRVLERYNVDYRSIRTIATVEIKKDEKAILELTEYLKCQFEIHSVDAIKTVQHKYKGSDFVEKSIGVRAVCEPCVELSGAALLTDKINCDGMTLCIGKLY